MNARIRATRLVPALCAVVVAAVLVAVFGQVSVARGDDLVVEGMDYFYGTASAQGEGGSIDILTVSGSANETVFVEMERDGQTIASHLAFTLGDGTAKRDDSGRYVGVVSANISDFRPASTYAVHVFADREQTRSLFEGTITPVYADLGGTRRLLALRTMGSAPREFTAPGSVSFGNATWKLASAESTSASPLTYAYEQADAADSIDGSIRYVDASGNVLRTDQIEGIARGTSRTVSVPSVITVGEGAAASWWRTVNFTGSLVASYPGTSDFTVRCVPLTRGEGSANAGNYYFAGVRFVDAQTGARVLAPGSSSAESYDDSLNVCGRYLYTPPTRLYVTGADGVVSTYVLNAQASHLSSAGALELDSATDGVTSGFKTFDVAYDRLPDDAATTWTVVAVNGAADPKAADREIARRQFEVKPGETATFSPEAKLTAGGKTMVPVSSTKDSYSYTFGAPGQDPVTYVYYVPEDYVAPEPYDVTVRYVNYATGEVLAEKSVTSRPDLRDELEIASPESFVANGVEYLRLAGQEQPIWHSYYSSARTYTIYYRDAADTAAAASIVRVHVVYLDGTSSADGSAAPAGASAGTNASAAGGATAVSVPSGEGALTSIDGANSSGMVDGSGRDTNEVRIDENQTPLAEEGAFGPWQSVLAGQRAVVFAAIGAGVLAVAIAVFLLLRKRRSDEGETEEK